VNTGGFRPGKADSLRPPGYDSPGGLRGNDSHCRVNVMRSRAWPAVRLVTVLVPILVAHVVAHAAQGQQGFDWPGIRGPEWNGHSRETGIVETWPAEGPPLEWTRPLGQGYSSFAAWDDRVATQYQTLAGQFVVCLDAATGATLWEHRYDWPWDPAGVYPGPRATPTHADGRLVFAGPNGLVGCLDAATGKPLWSLDLRTVSDRPLSGFGYSCSPTVVDGMVFLPVGGTNTGMVALDVTTGAVVWTGGSDAGSYAPALPVTFRGRRLVLGYLQNVLVCHDRTTGELLWRHPLSQGYDEHSSWPLYDEPWVWISGPFRTGAELLELRDDPAAPLAAHGRRRLIANDIFSSVLVDGAVFGFDVRDPQAKSHRPTRGVFRCIDLVSGAERWSAGDGRLRRADEAADPDPPATSPPDDAAGPGHATVIAVDGKLILFNDVGELILIRASRDRYEPLARTAVLGGELCWTQPALSRRRLFVRNHSRAACVYLGAAADGASRLTTADIPQRGYRDVAAVVIGVEPEYAFDLPSTAWLAAWYAACVGILAAGFATAALLRRLPGASGDAETWRLVGWGIVFVAGCLGTTLLSQLRQDFVFTWPVALFAAYAPLVDRVRLSRRAPAAAQPTGAGWALLVFLVVCAGYFLACRRLSLVFEWAFLMGFPAAVPLSVAGRLRGPGGRGGAAWRPVLTLLAFTAFYWSAAAVLAVRVAPHP